MVAYAYSQQNSSHSKTQNSPFLCSPKPQDVPSSKAAFENKYFWQNVQNSNRSWLFQMRVNVMHQSWRLRNNALLPVHSSLIKLILNIVLPTIREVTLILLKRRAWSVSSLIQGGPLVEFPWGVWTLFLD